MEKKYIISSTDDNNKDTNTLEYLEIKINSIDKNIRSIRAIMLLWLEIIAVVIVVSVFYAISH